MIPRQLKFFMNKIRESGNISTRKKFVLTDTKIRSKCERKWSLEVAVLRTGCIITRGHPLQGPAGGLCDFIGVSANRGL